MAKILPIRRKILSNQIKEMTFYITKMFNGVIGSKGERAVLNALVKM